jgi:hypothetical protein
MGEVHELILRHGRQAAASISPERQRTHIEVAARILEEENNALGITYGGFCMTAYRINAFLMTRCGNGAVTGCA